MEQNETALRVSETTAELTAPSPALERTGMTLSPAQAAMVARRQRAALRETGRVEFSGGTLRALAEAFCGSPFIQRADWPDTLAELTELFYALKNETRDRLGDEALIRAMAVRFNGSAGGSADALASTPPEWFLRCDAAGGKEPEDD